jgi:hypothetical protein
MMPAVFYLCSNTVYTNSSGNFYILRSRGPTVKFTIFKSAARASMTSERLEDFILISSEKAVLDNIDLSVTVIKFAAAGRHCLFDR